MPQMPPPHPGPHPLVEGSLSECRAGYSLVELVVVLAIAIALLGIAVPSLAGVSRSTAISSGLSRISSAAAQARGVSSEFARPAMLVLDVAADRIRIEADTTLDGGAPPVVLHTLDLWSDLRLDLQASDPVACFDPRGMRSDLPACPTTSVVVRVERAGLIDSLLITLTGRVVR